MRLQGRSAWITGAAQGLGAAIAERLAQEGCDRLLLFDLQPLDAIAERLKNYRATVLTVQGDVANEDDVAEAQAVCAEDFGSLDILVANAGILISGEAVSFDTEDWWRVIEVNLMGYFLCARAAAQIMIEQGSGSIVQINSKSGLKGSYRNSAYSASKFGGIGLTQSLALELAPHNVRVNAVCPGNLLDSPLWQHSLFDQYAEKWQLPAEFVRKYYEAQTPLGRSCQYDDVCAAVVYLCSDEASYITGEAMSVTGGQL
ncbi:MAG: SDR family oxidoreductase [Armatimonadetes bacterium]|nr:SDR family oxidoreductase [Armatimonadota bacterium]